MPIRCRPIKIYTHIHNQMRAFTHTLRSANNGLHNKMKRKIKIHVLKHTCVCVCIVCMHVYDRMVYPSRCCMQKRNETENITNGIWIKLIRKTSQCAFDFDTIHILLSFFLLFFWYTVLFLCFFWVARIYTELFLSLLFSAHLCFRQSVSRRSVCL